MVSKLYKNIWIYVTAEAGRVVLNQPNNTFVQGVVQMLRQLRVRVGDVLPKQAWVEDRLKHMLTINVGLIQKGASKFVNR